MKGVDKMLYGGIEAGGTKFVCGIGNEQLQVIERKSFPTTTPEETMEQVFDFFDKYKGNIASIGEHLGLLIFKSNQELTDISPTHRS